MKKKEIIWNCRFHPTTWWHEVGCPHQEWDKKDLQSALETKKRFEQSGLAGQVITEELAKGLKLLRNT